MNSSHERSEIPSRETDAEEYTPLLLAFGPADHEFESEGADEDAESYILGYN
jgi:hypothetical protein